MSEVKVNKISPRTACGTVTLGDSGDTFTIPSGATINNQGTAVNFGATGSASWVTTVKTSSPFTAVAGEGYFVNTTVERVSVNLPAGTAGAVVAVKDYAGTFDTNAVTLVQNGSDKIGGSTVNVVLSTEGIAITLVFIDSTQGWLVTDDGLQSSAPPPAAYVIATGGTPTTCGDFKIHTFTGPGALCVSNAGNPSGSNTVSYMVIAGGGGGASNRGGGGGAGGFRESKAASDSYTASPLNATSGPTYNLPVSVQSYPIVVGAGAAGVAACTAGNDGSVSSFSTITSAGGGGGGFGVVGKNGGSGGGGAYPGPTSAGGAGNTPPVSPPQGNNGGTSSSTDSGSGGGSAGAVGTASSPGTAGSGGAGVATSINGTPTLRAGGGGGSGTSAGGAAGPGGGGAGYVGGGGSNPNDDATANTGGGGGASRSAPAGAGGSGIVVIRYKFQN